MYIYAIIKTWIILQCSSRVFIGLAVIIAHFVSCGPGCRFVGMHAGYLIMLQSLGVAT